MKKINLRFTKKIILLFDSSSSKDSEWQNGITLAKKFEEQGFLVDFYNYEKYIKNYLLNKFSSSKIDDLPSIIVTVSGKQESQFLDEDLIWIRKNTNCILLSILSASPCAHPNSVVAIYSHVCWIVDKSAYEFWKRKGVACHFLVAPCESGIDNFIGQAFKEISMIKDGANFSNIYIRDKIKVLFYVELPFSLGGTQKYVLNLLTLLDRRVFDLALLVPKFQMTEARVWKKNVKFHGELLEYTYSEIIGFKDYVRFTSGSNLKSVVMRYKPDCIASSTSGVSEWPLDFIGTPVVDTNHINGGVNKLPTLRYSLHISDDSERKWSLMGGDLKKSIRVNSITDERLDHDDFFYDHLKLLKGSRIAFGFHQRASDDIFSEIPLNAYSQVENENTCFILLNGSKLYAKQAKDLGLKNFIQLDAVHEYSKVQAFLNILDVYSHGRFCGELFPLTISEAMQSGLPVVTHKGRYNDGHKELLGPDACFAETQDEYSAFLTKLLANDVYRVDYGNMLQKRFSQFFNRKVSADNHIPPLLNAGLQKEYEKFVLGVYSPIESMLQKFKIQFILSYYDLKFRFYYLNYRFKSLIKRVLRLSIGG